jgi:hypothetical protein
MAFVLMTKQELIDNGFGGGQEDLLLDEENGILDRNSGWRLIAEDVANDGSEFIRTYDTNKTVPIKPIYLISNSSTSVITTTAGKSYPIYQFYKAV